MNNPFRSQLWQQTIKNENKLYPSEFCMSMTDPNGTFVRLSEINEMISDGILTVDFDKLEQRIFDKTVIKSEDIIMDKKFKHGDRVYHKNLKQYGFFIGYAWESEEECDVDFETEDGEMEQKHVSVNWLEPAQKTYNE